MTRLSGTAYGLKVLGVSGLPPVSSLTGADDDLIPVTVCQSTASPPAQIQTSGRSVRRLLDGRTLCLDRSAGTATYFGAPLTDDQLAHPYLGAAATGFSRWAGREAFHGGAFAANGRAWIVVGGSTAGKSTLMAALAAAGVPVLTDDIAVIDGTTVYAGPRAVDLRHPIPSAALGGGSLALTPSRLGTRVRMELPPTAARWPLGGWFFLHWGDGTSLTPVRMSALLGRLAMVRRLPGLPSSADRLLELAAFPAWDLTRPRDWQALAESVDAVVSAARDHDPQPVG
ncbi:hypothetical protein ACVBEQ_01425 [Nakamurella sp. GG22]